MSKSGREDRKTDMFRASDKPDVMPCVSVADQSMMLRTMSKSGRCRDEYRIAPDMSQRCMRRAPGEIDTALFVASHIVILEIPR